MLEGSLEAPARHPIPWQDPDFYDEEKLDAELRRQFDICHGCRRCHNLCDSFPRLFDLIDEAESMELDTVDSKDFKSVVDACTLCDMCFLTKCPYVPPHEFNLDLPHLMLRYRAVELKKGDVGFVKKQIAQTDRNGKLAGATAPLANWVTRNGNGLTRPVMQAVTGIDKDASVPKFHGKTLTALARSNAPQRAADAPASERKAVVRAQIERRKLVLQRRWVALSSAVRELKQQLTNAQVQLAEQEDLPVSECVICLDEARIGHTLRRLHEREHPHAAEMPPTALLAADLIAFHTFDYVRHFMNSCSRVLGTDITVEANYILDSGKRTAVTVDGLSRFLSLKVHDDALGPQPARLLEWVNARYTAGPRERLEKLPKVWQFAAVEVVV